MDASMLCKCWLMSLLCGLSIRPSCAFAWKQRQQPIKDRSDVWLTPEFDTFARQLLDEYKIPGLSIAIVDADETYSKGYGIATFPDEEVTPETLFCTASTTKAFTAAAVSFLVDDVKNFSSVQWTTPINTLIRDDFVLLDEYWTNHLTLEDAMSHRTGMPGWDSTWMVDSERTVHHRTRSLRYLPLSKPPRTTFQYCNIMFVVISHVIETVTGQWLGDFLRIHIYEPLNMTSTFLSLSDARNASNTVAHGYYWSSRTQDYEQVSYIDRHDFSGAGGTISNVLDYAKWLRMFLYQASPLSASAHSELLKPRTFLFEGVNPMFQQPAYTLGWNVMVYRGVKFYTHDGGLPGFGTKVLMIPEKKWAFAIMGNTGETSNMVALVLGFRLIDQLLGVPEQERYDWNASNQEALLASRKPFNKTAILHSLYPHLPSPAIPASLPLSSYAHSYHHPAYGTITFSTNCTNHFESDFDMAKALGKSNCTLVSTPASKVTVFLEHMSGDHFIAWEEGLYNRGALKAEFDVDVKGIARRLGLDLEPKIEGEMLWFLRVDERS